jgi:fructokinase
VGTVYTIGETVYDIIFRQNQPVAARPGGSMLNSAVSLGRCGVKVEMITELGEDKVGKLVMDFLAENGVQTSFLQPIKGFKTPVSLAFLDEQGNADYSFYKNYPRKRLEIDWPEAGAGDIVLFGSFYSLDPAVHGKITSFIKKSKEYGALVVFDPNIRKNHLGEIRKLMCHVEENISLAHIVRGSDEDFKNLYGLADPGKVYDFLKEKGCSSLIVTQGVNGTTMFTDRDFIKVPAKKSKVVSTIGAGDGFNAGLIFVLYKERISVENLLDNNSSFRKIMLDYAVTFATEVCSSFDNYISKKTGAGFHAHNSLA